MKDSKTDLFKIALINLLRTIPNRPENPEYTVNWREESNSIRHMTTSALRERRPVSANSF